MQATLNFRRINFVSALWISIALVLGAGIGATTEQLLASKPSNVTVFQPTLTPLDRECARLGGPRC